jgi:hypothetical protein
MTGFGRPDRVSVFVGWRNDNTMLQEIEVKYLVNNVNWHLPARGVT